MPGHVWTSTSIIDDLADPTCLRDLLVAEIFAICAETGRTFSADDEFERIVRRIADRYRSILESYSGQQGIGGDGAVAAVKALYRLMHEEYLNPVFSSAQDRAPTDDHANNLFNISSRGLVVYNFCYRFLVVVGIVHYGIDPSDQEGSDFKALIEAAVRNFETRTDHSFEQMRVRAWNQHRW